MGGAGRGAKASSVAAVAEEGSAGGLRRVVGGRAACGVWRAVAAHGGRLRWSLKMLYFSLKAMSGSFDSKESKYNYRTRAEWGAGGRWLILESRPPWQQRRARAVVWGKERTLSTSS